MTKTDETIHEKINISLKENSTLINEIEITEEGLDKNVEKTSMSQVKLKIQNIIFMKIKKFKIAIFIIFKYTFRGLFLNRHYLWVLIESL